MKLIVKKARSDNKAQPLPLCYPFDWSGLENFAYPLGSNRLPQVDLGKPLGLRYNPITIAQYGLYHLQRYAESSAPQNLETAERCVNWLTDNFRNWRGQIGAWVYDYDLNFYGRNAPWISGMAQAQGISLLLRFYQLRADARLLDITRRAFLVFLYPVDDGGVVSYYPDGSLVFEEYPTTPPSQVLNGHVFAILGIYDYACFWQDKPAQKLFELAIDGLKRNLRHYDTGFWNLYDLHPTRRLASPMYVKVHVQLLEIMADLCGDPFFKNYADKWRNYLASPVSRFRWLLEKAREKIRLRR
jgi:hypothetical protein